MDEVKRVFNPEFINRIDEVIVFRPLTEADMEKILDINLVKVEKKLKDKGVKFSITKEAKKHLIKQGFDPNYGARPILRTVQRMLEDPLSEVLLSKKMKSGDTVKIDYSGQGEVLKLDVV